MDWHDGHAYLPGPNDIWLTSNGTAFDAPAPRRLSATYYCETYQYMQQEYNQFPHDTKWDIRFTYNNELTKYPNVVSLPRPGYWRFYGKHVPDVPRDKMFSMVLSHRAKQLTSCDLSPIRNQFVSLLRNKSFIYWGRGWDTSDPNYQGESKTEFDWHQETVDMLARAKFGLALDTSSVNGFTTEKFWHALGAGTLPVYYGPASIKEFVPKDVFIFGFDFESPEAVIDYCENMSDAEWQERTAEGRLFWEADRRHAWESVFTTIDSTLRILL